MVSEIGASNFGLQSAYYQAKKADSFIRKNEPDNQPQRLAAKFPAEDKANFQIADRTSKAKEDTGSKSSSQQGLQPESFAYLSKALSTPYSKGADLYGSSFDGRNLQGGSYGKADLRASSLSGANLSGADLRGADLTGADLSGADLTGANLTGANFTGANIAGAKLSGAAGTKYDASGNLTIDKAITLPRLDISA
ncbi:MAG: pentapeptide repeat-containing protein [Alphaproteobacteria bacterium]|nr:pentapeptide repeat-containing protein [Alphaproteobacteria bacterium]